MAKVNGVILYEGASQLDGAPIVVIATGIAKGSGNGKTGAMVQTWILRADINPVAAINNGADSSVCGDCKHRGELVTTKGMVRNKKRRCYVRVAQAPRSVWDGYRRGIYPRAWDSAMFADRLLRVGSYGDPAAVPYYIWDRALAETAGHTGYTHQWSRSPEFAAILMASCDTPEERLHAKFLGFRTFRVRSENDPVETREGICPASREAGHKTTCDRCKACGGQASKAKVDMVIIDHGPGSTARRKRAA